MIEYKKNRLQKPKLNIQKINCKNYISISNMRVQKYKK